MASRHAAPRRRLPARCHRHPVPRSVPSYLTLARLVALRSAPCGPTGSPIHRRRSAGKSARTPRVGNFTRGAVGQSECRVLDVERDFPARIRQAASRWSPRSTTTGRKPFFSELLRKMSAISVLITAGSRNPTAPRVHVRARSRSRSCVPRPGCGSPATRADLK